jgi:hypothetical protein
VLWLAESLPFSQTLDTIHLSSALCVALVKTYGRAFFVRECGVFPAVVDADSVELLVRQLCNLLCSFPFCRDRGSPALNNFDGVVCSVERVHERARSLTPRPLSQRDAVIGVSRKIDWPLLVGGVSVVHL